MMKMRVTMMTTSGETGEPKIKASRRRGVGGSKVGRKGMIRHILLRHRLLVTMATRVASQPNSTQFAEHMMTRGIAAPDPRDSQEHIAEEMSGLIDD
jgi:hypothetical protein